jgi:probable F420-dependent oxidoreductase
MERYGITVPFEGLSMADQRPLVERLVDLGYTDVWSAEVNGADAFTPLVLASVWAPTLRLGTAIVPAFTRGPATIAQSAAALAGAAPGRFVLGVGTSSNVIVESWNGIAFDRPLARTRDLVRFLHRALAGEKVSERYETFAVDGFALGLPPLAERVPIFVAALREGMLRMAGREADGAIINWLSADDVSRVAPIVRDAGGGEVREVVARIFVAPIADPDTARMVGRRALTAYLNVPVYAAFHRWLGRGERLAGMWESWRAGDRKGALAAIPDDVVDELIVWGTPEACREHIARYVANGVTTPMIALLPGIDPATAIHDLAPR